MTEDDTFEALMKPDFDTLNEMLDKEFPDFKCIFIGELTGEIKDFIHKHYWSYEVFNAHRKDALLKSAKKHLNDLLNDF